MSTRVYVRSWSRVCVCVCVIEHRVETGCTDYIADQETSRENVHYDLYSSDSLVSNKYDG